MAAWVSRGFYRLGVWALKAAVIVVGCAGSALLLIAAISFGLGVLGWLKTGAWSFYTVGDALRSELGMDVSTSWIGLQKIIEMFVAMPMFEAFRLFPLEVSIQFGGSPMAASHRISRGFHRLALFLGAIPLLIGIFTVAGAPIGFPRQASIGSSTGSRRLRATACAFTTLKGSFKNLSIT